MNNARPRRHLLVFARNPIPGRVKTRLIPAMGPASATAVYWRMLDDTLATCGRVHTDRRELWVDQTDPAPALQALARHSDMSLHVQTGDNLGSRMHAALAETLQTGESAILIGSDCPEYDPPYLETAFQALEQCDAVLGPAADGGYVLIGLRRADPGVFHDVPWGTAGVLAATRHRLRQLGWRWRELPIKRDVDEPADLARFPHLTAAANIDPSSWPGH